MPVPSDLLKPQADILIDVCRRAYQKGYTAGTEGNFSLRISEDRFLITPSGLNKGLITTADLVVCGMNGEKIEGIHQPSSEAKIHTMIFQNRNDINAICHTHPVFVTTFSLAGESFDKAILPEFVIALGAALLVPYATPGSEQLAVNLKATVTKFDAFLLENHGALTLGGSMSEAFDRTEMLERYAEILFYYRQLGKMRLILREEVERLLEIGKRSNMLNLIKTAEDN